MGGLSLGRKLQAIHPLYTTAPQGLGFRVLDSAFGVHGLGAALAPFGSKSILIGIWEV